MCIMQFSKYKQIFENRCNIFLMNKFKIDFYNYRVPNALLTAHYMIVPILLEITMIITFVNYVAQFINHVYNAFIIVML